MGNNSNTASNPIQIYPFTNWKNLFNRFLFPILLVLSMSECSDNKKITYLSGDMTNIFRLAKKTNKKVFVLLTAGDCGKCSTFESFLDRQKNTVKILGEDYICYKANIENQEEREIAQILKCPSYPFPYFFKSDGTLISFGFPNSPNYDIADLSKISIQQSRFSELFNLTIPVEDYKNLVSLNMKAALLSRGFDDTIPANALVLYKRSLNIASYPYNIRNFNLLSSAKQKREMERKISEYSPTASDRMLYGDLDTYMKMDSTMESQIILMKSERANDYILIDEQKDLGELKKGMKYTFTFRLKNLSETPLVINSVTHPCDCVKLSWPSGKIQPNQSALIKGEFTPYEVGVFNKQIFIHSSSVKNPMGIFMIKGVVFD